MKPLKLIVSLGAAVCVFAVCNGRAQNLITNTFTFSATITTEGEPTTNSVNDDITYPTPKTASHGTTGSTGILGEIGHALSVQASSDTNILSKAAKLVLISGNNSQPEFAVIDGANFYPLTAIMSLITTESRVRAGTQSPNGLASPQIKDMSVVGLHYDDTSIITDGSGLQFTIQGIASTTTKDSTPVNGKYAESFSAKVSNMTGSGFSGEDPFVVTTATLTVSGSGTLSVPPPS